MLFDATIAIEKFCFVANLARKKEMKMGHKIGSHNDPKYEGKLIPILLCAAEVNVDHCLMHGTRKYIRTLNTFHRDSGRCRGREVHASRERFRQKMEADIRISTSLETNAFTEQNIHIVDCENSKL